MKIGAINFFSAKIKFIRDNLFTKNSYLKHDDRIATEDQSWSPATKRLIVLRRLELLHPSLLNYIANVFSHELQNHTLKDTQPLVMTQFDSLLNDVYKKKRTSH